MADHPSGPLFLRKARSLTTGYIDPGEMNYGMVLAFLNGRYTGGMIMHDPALWASWYLWLLAVPALVIGTLIRDWLQGRYPARLRRRR